MYDEEDITKRLTGRTLLSAELSKDDDTLTLVLNDGTVKFSSEGDCCSNSWIESIETPDLPAEITGVEEGGSVELPHPDHECLRVYNTSVATTRGHLVIEYRNSSNGYYGGWLTMIDEGRP